MTQNVKTKVLVVGGGPGGYVAAIRAGQLGLDVVLVESDRLGGTCLIRGCIPSKALIHAAEEFETICRKVGSGSMGITLDAGPSLDLGKTISWKDGVVGKLNGGVAALLKKAKVRVIAGWAVFSDGKTCRVDSGDGAITITAEHVILANGSLPVELPHLPFGGPIISSAEALSLDALPARLAVVGGGYIGLELGTVFRKFGSEVTIVEAAEGILPLYDRQLVEPVRKWLEQSGVDIHVGARATGIVTDGGQHALVAETRVGETISIPTDAILVTVGRRPATQGWGLENMAVDMAGPFVKVDDQCRTSMRNVWAIGDLAGEPMLAHKASAQGEMVAEIIAGKQRRFDPVAIPAVCFTEPEIVSIGLAPGDAGLEGIASTTQIFPFAANGRSLSVNAADSGGFVRVTAHVDNHKILGIQAVGRHVSELSGEFCLALEMGAVLEDIAGTIHAHPTLGEALHEASLRGLGHPLHI